MTEIQLRPGETITEDALLILQLATMVEFGMPPLSDHGTIVQANLLRVLRRAAALLHEQDRQPRDVNEHVAH